MHKRIYLYFVHFVAILTPVMSHLEIEGISKIYGQTLAVNSISLYIEKGECLALLGPSGCGKTTVLRLIAGLEEPDSGRLILTGRDITRLPPESRRTGLVFQNYALFPHLSVAENVAFGLEVKSKPRKFIDDKVSSALELVQLENFGKRRVQELSGGEQQRVAIARVLAIEPEVLLLDEPLSNLDVTLREQTGQQLRALIERLRITTIFVTHDQSEAFALADRIALMSRGQLQQTGSASELYFNPGNIFVARFIGRGNFLSARLCGQKNGLAEYEVEGQFRVLGPAVENRDTEVMLRIRPEAIQMQPEDESQKGLAARILTTRFSGSTIHYSLDVSGVKIEALSLTPSVLRSYLKEELCRIHIPPEAVTVFPKDQVAL
jgi:putative spermidine/putrescine transport system ATP-binding protein